MRGSACVRLSACMCARPRQGVGERVCVCKSERESKYVGVEARNEKEDMCRLVCKSVLANMCVCVCMCSECACE